MQKQFYLKILSKHYTIIQQIILTFKELYTIYEITSNLSSVVQPGVNCVTGRAQIRLSKLVFLGPAQWCIAQTLLNDCMEPGQQEVQTSTLVGSLLVGNH